MTASGIAPRSSTVEGTLAVVLLAIALFGVGAFVTLSALSATEYDAHGRSDAPRTVPGAHLVVLADPHTSR